LLDDHRCIDHLRSWLLKNMSGCSFASQLAGAATMSFAVLLDDVNADAVPAIDAFIEGSADQARVAILIFPRIRTANGIGRILGALTMSPGWLATIVPWKDDARTGAKQIGLEFQARHGTTSAMGFAPLGCMPVTRRTPYVALAVWAGGKRNPHKQTPGEGSFGFIDIPPVTDQGSPMTESAHTKTWDATKEKVRHLLNDPKEDPVQLRRVAFCLPEPALSAIAALR
jgi:hypothetical protein